MRKVVIAAIVLVTVAAWAWGKDVVSMPEIDTMKPGQAEIAYIYWDLDPVQLGPRGPWARDYAHVFELFVGVLPRLELDVIHVSPEGPLSSVTELNAYIRLLDETEKYPAVVVGATNLTGSDWLPSEDRTGPSGDTRVSPFILVARTLRKPMAGPPTPHDPAIRLQLGYGWNYHEQELFGILQFAFTPNIVAALQSYRGDFGWLVGWQQKMGWGVHVGALGGEPYVHVRYDFTFAK